MKSSLSHATQTKQLGRPTSIATGRQNTVPIVPSAVSRIQACVGADVIILSVPPAYVAATIDTDAHTLDDNAILVSPSVEMTRDGSGFHYVQPSNAESHIAVAAGPAPADNSVVGAFHNISAKRLATLDVELGIDTLVIGDDPDATATVANLAEEIDGLRAVDAGPIANAKEERPLHLSSSTSRCRTTECTTSASESSDHI